MRKIFLEEGQTFDASMLERDSAFDANALKSATDIVATVREQGDAALRAYSEKFDHVTLGELEVSKAEVEAAFSAVDNEFLEAIKYAAENIRSFHERQLQQSWFTTRKDGAITGQRFTPLQRVGIYVPGGRAQYPSTVLMNALPAHVAGVDEIVMCTPPSKDGTIDPHTLVAANVAGVDRIFKVGGAQAIAAMAYGTQSVPAVNKVTGPGNAFVAAAKKIVNGDVGIDMIAGPSEVCVVADETAVPEFVAIDLMAQAEHDPKATCYFVTTEEGLLPEVEDALGELLEQSERREITEASLEHGLVVVCKTLTQVFDAVNTIAPEHLELDMADPWELLGSVRNAGAIFLGPWTPEAVGDYIAGPNHTLPTGGTAAYASPLSVDEFMKKSSVLSYTYDALEAEGDKVQTLAAAESLWAHGRSVKMRLDFMDYVQSELANADADEDEGGDECCGHDHGKDGD
ncbi:MAG: histidinol dehydrogenase [Coriobacteriales bacterium]|jgi:histidinol dehydrogenase